MNPQAFGPIAGLLAAVAGALIGSHAEAAASEATSVRRFALIAAANDGGEGRARLRYAESDAQTLADVLRQLGGVAPQDESVLVQPSPEDFYEAFESLRRQLEAAAGSADRLELIVYYSGHSDSEGLLLAGERYEYGELKRALSDLPADVRIAILDSCASGAMTRTKGGTRRPPFTVDASNQVRGYAVLTSSSEDESAQESDRIEASFFTHYLVSGLRGAGDLSRDGRVTLNEAYHFAFHETLARTERTMGGAQHPAYDIQLVGTGDVVMTDLRSIGAGLRIDESAFGRFFLRDESGRLAVELRKDAGREVELGLEPGPYGVTVEQDGVRFQGEVALVEGQITPLALQDLRRIEGEPTTLRGSPEYPAARRVVPVDVGLIPPLSINGVEEPTLNYFSLSLGMSYARDLHGAGFALGAGWLENELRGFQTAFGFLHAGGRVEGVQLSFGFNNAGGELEGVQSTLGFNLVKGPAEGVQASLGFNYAKSTLEGLQGALGFNAAGDAVEGVQAALGVNYAPKLTGAQFSNGVNVVEDLEGAQLGMVNIATGETDGAQIGMVNVETKDAEGAQIGMVNIAGANDFQLGLVNYTQKTEGVSLGLISYAADDGILDFALFSSDAGLGGIAAEIGTKHLYTAASFAVGTWEVPDATSFGLHWGGRVYPAKWLEVSIDVGTQWVDVNGNFEETDLLNSLRVRAGLRVSDPLLVFVGPTFNVLVDLHDAGPDRAELAPSYAARPRDDRVYLYPGLVAGIQFF